MSIVAGQAILASDFKDTSAGAADAGKGIKLDSIGKIANAFMGGLPSVSNVIHGESNDQSNPRGATDDINIQIFPTGTNTWALVNYNTGYKETRSGTSDYAASTRPCGLVVIGAYAYVGLTDGTTPKVYRFDITNIAAGGTLMTTSGQALGTTGYTRFNTDGTHIYFNKQAGNSANSYIFSKYSISGTVLTWVSDTTCGSTAGESDLGFYVRASDGHIITWLSADQKIRRYNTSGTLQATSNAAQNGMIGNHVAGRIFFIAENTNMVHLPALIP